MKIIPDFQRLNSGENLSRKIRLYASDRISGNECVLSFVTPMGKIYITDKISLHSGEGEYVLPSLLLDGKGVLFCQMSVSGENGYLIKSDVYEFPVYSSCDTEDYPEADEKSIKSLSAVFELLDGKSDKTHEHNGLYFLKEETERLLTAKSNIGHSHDERYYTQVEIDELFSAIDISHTHDGRYYTKTEADELLSGKSASGHIHDGRYYTESETDGLLSGKSDSGHIHDDRYYTESETDGLLSGKSDLQHTHDDRYYTENETDALLSAKSDSGHSHSYETLENKPGDVSYDSVIFSFDSLPESRKDFVHGGHIIEFSHNVKEVPPEVVLKLSYTLAGSDGMARLSYIRYFGDNEPVGEIFVTENTNVSFSQFFSEGFPESAGENAFAIYLKPDGTGQLITKYLITGSRIVFSGPDNFCEKWITLPSSAVESTWETKKNDTNLITSGGVYRAMSSHNTDAASHQDVRLLLSELSDRINAVADSDDTTLDQLSEIVAYIKSNKSLIDAVTTEKISYSDIINNLETNVTNKPLSAAMGVFLKSLIDAIIVPTKVSELSNDMNFVTGAVFENKLNTKQDKLSQYVSSVNGKNGDVTLSHSDVGALSAGTFIPSKVSDLTNDAEYVKSTELDEALSEVQKPFVITATADLANMTATNVSRSFNEIAAAYGRGDHIIFDVDVGQMIAGQHFQISLTSFLPENYAYFEAICNFNNGAQSAHLYGLLHANGNTSFKMIPLVQSSQIGGLSFVVSSSVPTVDDRNVITFVTEE